METNIVMSANIGSKRKPESIVVQDSKANAVTKQKEEQQKVPFTTKRVSFGISDEKLYEKINADFEKIKRQYGINMSFSAFIQHKLKSIYDND